MILEAGKLCEEHLGSWVSVADPDGYAVTGTLIGVQHMSPVRESMRTPSTTIRVYGDDIEVASDDPVSVLEEAPF